MDIKKQCPTIYNIRSSGVWPCFLKEGHCQRNGVVWSINWRYIECHIGAEYPILVHAFYVLHQAVTSVAYRAKQAFSESIFELALKSAQTHFQAFIRVAVFIDTQHKFLLAANSCFVEHKSLYQQGFNSCELYSGFGCAQFS